MFERKIYNDIVSWHESLKIKKRALIIKGLDKLVKQQLLESFVKNITKSRDYSSEMIERKGEVLWH